MKILDKIKELLNNKEGLTVQTSNVSKNKALISHEGDMYIITIKKIGECETVKKYI